MVKYLIFDIGTFAVRAKIYDDYDTDVDATTVDTEVRTVVGRLKDRLAAESDNAYETLYGESAIENVDRMKLYYPVDHGCIDNVQDLCDIIDHITFNLLEIDPPPPKDSGKESSFPYQVIILDNTLTPKHTLQKIGEHISFWNVQTVYNIFSLTNVMYHNFGPTNNTVCLIVDIGAGCCKLSAFMYNFRSSTSRRISVVDVGLEDVLDEIQVELNVRYGGQFAKTKNRQWLRQQLSDYCYVSDRPLEDSKLPPESFQVSLPLPSPLTDGTSTIEIQSERWLAYEILFDPSRVGRSSIGIAGAIVNEIKSAPLDYVSDLSRNIFICGAGALVTGLVARIQKEVSRSLQNVSVKCSDAPETAQFAGLFEVLNKKSIDGVNHKGDVGKIFNECVLLKSRSSGLK